MYEKAVEWKDVKEFDYDCKVNSSGFDISITLYGPNEGDQEIINTYVFVKAHVEDFGIGSYEFGGAKGKDIQLGWEIDEIYLTDSFPLQLKAIEEKIIEQLIESINEDCEISHDDDDGDNYDGGDYDRYADM